MANPNPKRNNVYQAGNKASVGHGRNWLSEPERRFLGKICKRAVMETLDIIENDEAPWDVRLKAMELIFNCTFGKPQMAMLVRYEVDLII